MMRPHHYHDAISYASSLVSLFANYRDGYYSLDVDDLSELDQTRLAFYTVNSHNFDATEMFERNQVFQKFLHTFLNITPHEDAATCRQLRKNLIEMLKEDMQDILNTCCFDRLNHNPFEIDRDYKEDRDYAA